MPRRLWLFDLDNTLHDADPHIFPRINRAMTRYVMTHLGVDEAQANALRVGYWQRYGATLTGLVRHHGVDPAHFLHHTHQFPDLHRVLVFEWALRNVLCRLPGRKVIFSNGPSAYIGQIVERLGVGAEFGARYGIEQLGLHPKPQRRAFRAVLQAERVAARRCILVDDTLANLRAAKALGMRTVWLTRRHGKPPYVDVRLRSILHLRRVATLA